MYFYLHNMNKGFIALTSIIIISALLAVLTLQLSALTFEMQQEVGKSEHNEQAYYTDYSKNLIISLSSL